MVARCVPTLGWPELSIKKSYGRLKFYEVLMTHSILKVCLKIDYCYILTCLYVSVIKL